MLESITILSGIILGIVSGSIAGIIPGFHVNNVASLALLIYLTRAFISPLPLAVFLLTSAISYTFFNYLSSSILKSPQEDTYMLPEMSRETLLYTFHGALFSFPLIILSLPLLNHFLPKAYDLILNHLFIVLLIFSLTILLISPTFQSILLTSLATLLVVSAFNSNLNSFFVLSPIFLGFFGMPSLLAPAQENKKDKREGELKIKEYSISLTAPFIAVLLSTLIPSSSPSFFNHILLPKKIKEKGKAIAIGVLSMSDTLLSIFSLYFISNSRSGVGVVISNILPKFSTSTLALFIAISSLTLIISYLLASNLYTRIKHLKLNRKARISIGIILLLITYFMLGTEGVIVLILASLLGYYRHVNSLPYFLLLFPLTFSILLSYLI